MLFLGQYFNGSKQSLAPTPTDLEGITMVMLTNGIFDELYGDRKVCSPWDGAISSKWDFDTVMHALFQENLYAGNVNFTADTVTSIRIKKRKKGTFKWFTVFEIPIDSDEDFNFERNDSYNRSNTEYEYAFVPTLNGIEGNFNMNSILSDFQGVFLVERDVMYQALLNVELSQQLNRETGVVHTLGRKYPYYVSNGNSGYVSLDLNAAFIEMDEHCDLDISGGWKYREQVDEFLSNNRVKLLKTDEGKIWMVCVTGNIEQNSSQHEEIPLHSIQMIEIGDAESPADLYDNNFTDIDLDVVRG